MQGNINFQSMVWKKGQILGNIIHLILFFSIFYKIGKGGFGNVYLGLNSDTGELFAVKQLEVDTSFKTI